MKNLFLLFLLAWSTLSVAQSKTVIQFVNQSSEFEGSKLQQAEFLTRKVLPFGKVDSNLSEIPPTLSMALNDSLLLPDKDTLENYLNMLGLSAKEIGGELENELSRNKKDSLAKYFVIHDVSYPNYKLDSFPNNINDISWKYNQVEKYWKAKRAHVFVGRTGRSYSPVYFETPWRATKFELSELNEVYSKGLFLHIELVQPRRSDSTKWKNNDIIAPNPGFSIKQYDRLALLYIIASARKGEWLVPAFHAVLDEGIKGAHDDPQNFELNQFDQALKSTLKAINNLRKYQIDSFNLWATYYYLPTLHHDENGIELLDENEIPLNVKLDSCNWCNAAIQGTVCVIKDEQHVTYNYAGRSKKLQYDCRKCPKLKKYDGYEKTGQVLWTKIEGNGYGVNNYHLVPFKTIAVDSSVIPYGSVVYIPDAVGVIYKHKGKLLEHDGYFFAGDTGSKIIGNHIDVFIGAATKNPFGFVKSNKNKTFQAYIVHDQKRIKELENLHK